jgi:hypothetical protein
LQLDDRTRTFDLLEFRHTIGFRDGLDLRQVALGARNWTSIEGEFDVYWRTPNRAATFVFPDLALNSFERISFGESAKSRAFTASCRGMSLPEILEIPSRDGTGSASVIYYWWLAFIYF